jgi:hypothetical protein
VSSDRAVCRGDGRGTDVTALVTAAFSEQVVAGALEAGRDGVSSRADCVWAWTRLLYLHREKQMAMTTDGWIKLGKRMSA